MADWLVGPWDVVVVGGGPAGSATAARLASLGHAVLLLDREQFPRPKPCGECVNPAAVTALARLGVLSRVEAAQPAHLDGWKLHSRDGSAFRGCFPAGRRGLGIPRAVLDSILLDHARACGAAVYTGARVGDLVLRDGRIAGVRAAFGTETFEILARLVVGADGLRSVVVRRLGLIHRAPRLHKVALTAHVRGLEGLGECGELHATAWGCIGAAEVGNGVANVTVVVTGTGARAVAGNREGFFDRSLAASPRFRNAWRVNDVLATGPFDWPTRRAVADGALLVGDAAGYYDPFTGQGIFRALRSAELAAEVADTALRAGEATAAALAPYEQSQRRAFAPGVRLQHLIEAVVSRPRLFDVVAKHLRRHSALADALITVTGDVKPLRSLLRPDLLVRGTA